MADWGAKRFKMKQFVFQLGKNTIKTNILNEMQIHSLNENMCKNSPKHRTEKVNKTYNLHKGIKQECAIFSDAKQPPKNAKIQYLITWKR